MFGFWWGEGFLLGVVMVAVEWLLCSLRRVASLCCFGFWFAGVVCSVCSMQLLGGCGGD